LINITKKETLTTFSSRFVCIHIACDLIEGGII